jgi:hypothetical protein
MAITVDPYLLTHCSSPPLPTHQLVGQKKKNPLLLRMEKITEDVESIKTIRKNHQEPTNTTVAQQRAMS